MPWYIFVMFSYLKQPLINLQPWHTNYKLLQLFWILTNFYKVFMLQTFHALFEKFKYQNLNTHKYKRQCHHLLQDCQPFVQGRTEELRRGRARFENCCDNRNEARRAESTQGWGLGTDNPMGLGEGMCPSPWVRKFWKINSLRCVFRPLFS